MGLRGLTGEASGEFHAVGRVSAMLVWEGMAFEFRMLQKKPHSPVFACAELSFLKDFASTCPPKRKGPISCWPLNEESQPIGSIQIDIQKIREWRSGDDPSVARVSVFPSCTGLKERGATVFNPRFPKPSKPSLRWAQLDRSTPPGGRHSTRRLRHAPKRPYASDWGIESTRVVLKISGVSF